MSVQVQDTRFCCLDTMLTAQLTGYKVPLSAQLSPFCQNTRSCCLDTILGSADWISGPTVWIAFALLPGYQILLPGYWAPLTGFQVPTPSVWIAIALLPDPGGLFTTLIADWISGTTAG
jgi:hypothetical protein